MREEIGDLGLQPDLLPGALRHVPADAGDASRLAGSMESAGRQCSGGCRREGGQGEMALQSLVDEVNRQWGIRNTRK